MERINDAIKRHLEKIKVDLYHLEWDKEFGVKILRIIVDKLNKPIDIEEIISISKYISLYLDENEPTTDDYSLEVMSAGIERELYTQEHWEKSVDKIVFVVLKKPLDNVKRLFAKVINVKSNEIHLITNDEKAKLYKLKLNEIKKANWAYKEKENAR